MKKTVRLVTIVGTRPQFVKAAVVNKAIKAYNRRKQAPRLDEVLVHTGQHYDSEMSQVFFDQLDIPTPQYHLGVRSGRHGEQTAKMLARIEGVLIEERPDLALVYGDTNSTLAGALAAVKMNIPIAHVEAGLRSHNRRMPEEINRILTDRISSLLFCPTEASILNLKTEGIVRGVHRVGDVMLDAFLLHKKVALKTSEVLRTLDLKRHSYCLATVHRQENADDPVRLHSIFSSFSELANERCPIIVPLHPRTRKSLLDNKLPMPMNRHVRLIPPINYLDMVALESQAKAILTDSGGVQREAYFARVPCVTLRDETEWTETVESGWNIVAGAKTEAIVRAFAKLDRADLPEPPPYFGDGKTSERIVKILAGLTQ
ncbi:MAG: UDP-N-acetylglucosamine 2-epimerase (non-hydrolyzing) [Candidatus Aminicenantales bacterium]